MDREIIVIHDDSYRSMQALEVHKKLKDQKLTRKLIITCGLEVIDKAIAAKEEGDVLVSILDPGRDYDKFDLIFVPKHDPHPKLANVRTTLGLINRVNPEVLVGEERIRPQKKQVIAVLIGGRHVGGNFTSDDAAKLANIINKADCAALVTTSKRTEAKTVKVLRQELWRSEIFYDYNLDGQAANPYLKILASADKIIVTADSVRMCSEACSSGKQVFIFTPEKLHFSYAALRDSLFKAGAALDVGELQTSKPTATLNEAERIAKQILEFCNKI